jgi:hypothetical protein
MNAREVTVLECTEGKRLAKLIDTAGRVHDYDAGFLFRASAVEVPTLEALATLLRALDTDAGACIIRGAKRPGGAEWTPRRMHDREDLEADFEACPRAWLCLDLDASTVTAGTDEPTMRAAIGAWRGTLPPCLREAGMVFQLSSKAGMVPYLRGHAWFMLTCAVEDPALRAWLLAQGFDDSACLANAVQVHYTAGPVGDGVPWSCERVYAFVGPDAVVDVTDVPAPEARTMGTRERVPREVPEASERIVRLAEAVRPAFERGGRIAGNALLNFFGWALSPTHLITKGDLRALLDVLDEADVSKAAEHLHVLGNAVALEGPGAAREWLGAEFDTVDAIVNEPMRSIRLAAQSGGVVDAAYAPIAAGLLAGDLEQPLTLSGASHQMWVRTQEGYAGPYGVERLPVVTRALGSYELVCLSGEGKPYTDTTLYRKGSHVETVVRDFADTRTWFDRDTATLHQGYTLPVVEAMRSEAVEAWLTALTGEMYEHVLTWIRSCAQDCIARKAAALVLVSYPGTGKTLIFTALARLWGARSFVPLTDSVAQFNGTITRCPVVLDDEVKALRKREVTSAEFRSRVQARERDYEPKCKEKVQLLGCTREAITANDLEEVTFADVRGAGVVDALRDRLLVVEVPDHAAAVAALMAVRGPEDDDELELARIVGHLAWVWATRSAPRGQRFLGAGGAAAERVALAGAVSEHAELWEALRELLEGAPEKPAGSPLPGKLALFREGELLYAYPAGVLGALGMQHRIGLAHVQRALGAFREGPRKPFEVPGAGVVRYWPLSEARLRQALT